MLAISEVEEEYRHIWGGASATLEGLGKMPEQQEAVAETSP